MRIFASILIFLIQPALAAADNAPTQFCKAAKAQLELDRQLAEDARAVYPLASFAQRDDDCLFPLKILRYRDMNVLMVADGTPGEGCHGCGAKLSAYVLRQNQQRLNIDQKIVDFSTIGTSGDPGKIDSLQLGGHDAFVAESGGDFQGYRATGLDFFIFRGRQLIQLQPSIPLSADDVGAVDNDLKSIDVAGTWHVGFQSNDTLVVHYAIKAGRIRKQAAATWKLKGTRLTLASGSPPKELAAASGQ